MITDSYDDNSLLKSITDFYVSQIHQDSILEMFNIYFTDNILEDIKIFNKGKTINILADGVTILPLTKDEKFILLINKCAPTELQPQYILHELCHAYDFIRFGNKFCSGKHHKIRKHKYCSTLLNWSEFHVQIYSIPYTFRYFTYLNNYQFDYYIQFKNQINTYYYNWYNNKLLSKQNITISDIMYYIGEIAMCKKENSTGYYPINHNILKKYPFVEDIKETLDCCLTFKSFCNNIKELYLKLK